MFRKAALAVAFVGAFFAVTFFFIGCVHMASDLESPAFAVSFVAAGLTIMTVHYHLPIPQEKEKKK